MKKLGYIGGVLLVLFISGCNGGGGNSSGGNSRQTNTLTSTGPFTGNGIYSGEGHSFMLVDSTRSKNNVLLAVLDDGEFYVVDSAVAAGSQMITQGITQFDGNTLARDPSYVATANFTSDTVDIIGNDLIFSMNKTENSMPLDSLSGTHSNGEGSSWNISEDGSFVLNHSDGCLVSGNLELKDSYYNIENALVSSCPSYQQNGTYSGVMLTLNVDGNNGMIGILANENSFVVDSVLVN